MKPIILLLFLSVIAYSKSVTATFSYAMGDRDTKIEAKKIAFAEAKRMAIEKIGVWIESETNIVDGQMERDKIRSFVLGYAQTKIVSENFDYPRYTVTVEVEIDDEQLKSMRQNGSRAPAVPEPVRAGEPVAEPTRAVDELPREIVQPESATKQWYSGLEVGALFGSGSVTITQTAAVTSDETREKQGIGFGGLKITYLFTKNHAIEFIGGGGSTEQDSGNTLQLDTSAIAYQYHFDRLASAPVIPYLAFGITSGKATLTNGSSETVYQGSGAVLHAGGKWFFKEEEHHLLEAGLLVQSFKDEEHEAGSGIKSIQFERSMLAFGYSYRF